MDFSHSEKVRELQERVTAFMDEHVYPAEEPYHKELERNQRECALQHPHHGC